MKTPIKIDTINDDNSVNINININHNKKKVD